MIAIACVAVLAPSAPAERDQVGRLAQNGPVLADLRSVGAEDEVDGVVRRGRRVDS